jgi:hypothetical protein
VFCRNWRISVSVSWNWIRKERRENGKEDGEGKLPKYGTLGSRETDMGQGIGIANGYVSGEAGYGGYPLSL